MRRIIAHATDTGFYCIYRFHGWAEVVVEETPQGTNLRYNHSDFDPSRVPILETESRLERELGQVDKDEARRLALEALKTNVSGVVDDKVEFIVL